MVWVGCTSCSGGHLAPAEICPVPVRDIRRDCQLRLRFSCYVQPPLLGPGLRGDMFSIEHASLFRSLEGVGVQAMAYDDIFAAQGKNNHSVSVPRMISVFLPDATGEFAISILPLSPPLAHPRTLHSAPLPSHRQIKLRQDTPQQTSPCRTTSRSRTPVSV